MPVIAQTEVLVSGDIGGIGIARFTWNTGSGGAPTPTECSSAGDAAHTLFNSTKAVYPSDITWQVQQVFKTFDQVSGELDGLVASPTPFAAVSGVDSAGYGAGLGARGFWHTNTVLNRRLVRGALYFVPLGGGSYSADGAINAGTVTLLQGALSSYLSDMATAGIAPVIWSRPTTKTSNDGSVAEVVAGSVGNKPAGLRSRRS